MAARVWRLSALVDPGRRTRFDLEVYVRPGAESFKLEILYATDLFDAATIGRLAGQFQTWLEGALAAPDLAIDSLPILTEIERRLIIDDWSGSAVLDVAPDDVCVTSMFAEQVALHPGSVALVGGDLALSYAELDRRANRLARYLRVRGVGPDVRVAIFAERSPDLIVAVLAVLKAGGAYVPLDPGYPAERLQCMLHDAQPLMLLTPGRLRPQLEGLRVRTFPIDADLTELGVIDDSPLEEWRSAENLAYVLYTSGSTGVPKGVAMGHRPLSSLVRWQCSQSGLGINARTLQFAPIGFDVSFQEIFSTVCSGGTLVLMTEDDAP